MWSLEYRIERLERRAQLLLGSVRGTKIERVLADPFILRENGLRVPDSSKESRVVWGVGVGGMGLPKLFFYGFTIEQAVRRAYLTLGREIRGNKKIERSASVLRGKKRLS